jgi:taurine dioxygenase
MAMSEISKTRVRVDKFGGHIGAIISNVDLRINHDKDVYAEIRHAFDEHGVIFIYDQELTMEQYVAFGRKLGTLAVGDGQPHAPQFPELQVMVKAPEQKMGTGDTWHADQTFRTAPTKGTALRAVEIPPYGGDTLFVSTAAAFEALPASMQEILRTLNAVHSRPFIIKEKQREFSAVRYNDVAKRIDEFAIHPVVIRHPDTGRELLFINPGYTSNIEGWTQEQSEPLLNQLYAHCLQPEYQCRFRWKKNAIAYWDNRQTWHYAVNDYHGCRREMHRLMVQ